MIDHSYSGLMMEESQRDKQLKISCGEKIVTNENLHYEKFTLTQSICSESELKFGGCESGMIEFQINRMSENDFVVGDELTVELTMAPFYDNPLKLGTFIVYSNSLINNRKAQTIKAYDKMYSIKQIEISKWIESLIFPMTVKQFRDLLFTYLECDYVPTELINDNVTLYRAATKGDVYAGDVLKDICALNACFGVINNEGNFEFISLDTNSEKADFVMYTSDYQQNGFEYEMFKTQPITAIWLQEKANNEDWLYKDGSNVYSLELNTLYFGDNVKDLNTICDNFYQKVKDITYRPYEVGNVIGNFCVECGDKFSATLSDGEWRTKETFYIFERKITGIQSLKDTYTTQGVEVYSYYNEAQKALSNIESQISNLNKDVFGALTFINGQNLVIQQGKKDIIQFNIATSDKSDSEVIFLATIPIYVDYDGELVIYYRTNGTELTGSTASHYLNAGYNIVTITNHFNMNDSMHMVLDVSAQIKLLSTNVQEEHTAYIKAFEKYINTGVYEEPVIDTYMPTGEIAQEAIKATVFVQNLVKGSKWDGMVVVSQEFNGFDWSNSYTTSTMTDKVSVTKPKLIVDKDGVNQQIQPFGWKNKYSINGFEEEIGNELT